MQYFVGFFGTLDKQQCGSYWGYKRFYRGMTLVMIQETGEPGLLLDNFSNNSI